VAKEFGLNSQGVAAMRERAFANGLFSVSLHAPQERVDVCRLEAAVKARFGLRKVLLVPGRIDIIEEMDQSRRRALHTEAIRDMADLVARYLDEIIGAAVRQGPPARQPDGSLMFGVAWGRSMRLNIKHLQSTPRPVRCPWLKVVPIVGITATLNAEPVEANIIAMAMAELYGGVSEQLPVPAFVRAIEYDVATQQKPIRQMLLRLQACDIVLTSMGPIPDRTEDGSEITLSNDPTMNARLLQSARRDGAIGEICYSLFDREGREVCSDYRAIGLGFAGLRKIAADPTRQVILVAGGDRRRFEPLKAALRAGLASVLVSDTVTARYLVDEPLTA
jgi:DNA-binding transcriptional regulator LsrR (DeoR family)